MKKTILFIFLTASIISKGQNTIIHQYHNADSLLKANNYLESYKIFKEIEQKDSHEDTLYSYIVWYYTTAVTNLVKQKLDKEDWSNSLDYGLEALNIIRKGEKIFDENYKARKYWMYSKIIISYFGLNQLDKAKKYQDTLYAAYKSKTLPKGIDNYYEFDYFKCDNKNAWGSEYYPELGDPETEGSYAKIEYDIYSTNPDGSDKDELYRLYVLKFHKLDNSVDFDYVLTKRIITEDSEVSGTLYSYTYKTPIDFVKLRADIKEVVKGNIKPDTKSIINKKNK